jgi:hypothetical protein
MFAAGPFEILGFRTGRHGFFGSFDCDVVPTGEA